MHAAHGQSGHARFHFPFIVGVCAFRIGDQILHKHAGKRTGAYPAINCTMPLPITIRMGLTRPWASKLSMMKFMRP